MATEGIRNFRMDEHETVAPTPVEQLGKLSVHHRLKTVFGRVVDNIGNIAHWLAGNPIGLIEGIVPDDTTADAIGCINSKSR